MRTDPGGPEPDEPPDALTLARARAGRAIRDLGHAFVGRHASVEQIERLADVVAGVTAELWPQEPRSRGDHPFASLGDHDFPQGRFDHGYDDRPVSGRASPLGCDLDLHRYGDEIEAHVTFRSAHEGAPGRCHGGLVAALFDDVFGFMLGVVGEPAFTGTLSIRYEGPAPIEVPLACRVRLGGRDGRKLHMTGELRVVATGEIVTTATALFIAIPVESFRIGSAPSTAQRPPPPDEGAPAEPIERVGPDDADPHPPQPPPGSRDARGASPPSGTSAPGSSTELLGSSHTDDALRTGG